MRALSRFSPLAIAMLLLTLGAGTAGAQNSIGGGLHYLRNLGDITETDVIDLSQDSFSLIGSFQRKGPLLKLEGQVEYIFDYIGTGEEMWQPSAWAMLGNFIYGGAGIGIGYTNDDWQQNPFYALRAGVELALGGMNLDLYASYRFQSDQELEDLTEEDLDSLTFAGILRFGL